MNPLVEISFSWALYFLPAYAGDTPPPPPLVELKPHSFFVENVCGGKECNVIGWYNDTGTIYLDNRLRSPFLEEILLHEIVHYLQHMRGDFDTYSCADSIKREREAYYIQNRYRIEARMTWPKIFNATVRCAKPPQQETP